MNIFEKASRTGLRFNYGSNLLTVEDLWNLPLTGNRANLNDIAKQVSREIKASEEEDFVGNSSSKAAITLQLKMDILKHIISERKTENAAKLEAAANKAKKERIKEILAKKQEQSLEQMDEKALQELLESL